MVLQHTLFAVMLGATCIVFGAGCDPGNIEEDGGPPPENALPYVDEPSFQVQALNVVYDSTTDAVVFEMRVLGDAGAVRPQPAGQIDGAPVLGYVFLTDLDATDVGFDAVEGTVALAITSHPDFDDTPLWDEDRNFNNDDDGVVYHSHWVLLQEDDRAPGGLAVRQSNDESVLPPTAPMPMYLDSPGFTVVEDADTIRVVVPSDRIKRRFNVNVGGVTAYMEVDASGDQPLLAVHGILSAVDDGALLTTVQNTDVALTTSWPTPSVETPTEPVAPFEVDTATAEYIPRFDSFVLTMRLLGTAGAMIPEAVGAVNGAPVLGYVFPTTIPPESLGFRDISGTVALAVTSHPDFDDTPLWDETNDGSFANDGGFFHVHWAVLVDDAASAAGLSVPSQPNAAALPATAPMPMYLDSPGFHAFAAGNSFSVVIPAWHLRDVESFSFDALTARMQVDASGDAPVLRVEEVYSLFSGDLSLPFNVSKAVLP